MSAENLDIPIAYEQLEDIEDDFEEVELELIRQQTKLTEALYVKREKVISQIPNFWPLVFEQSPADIDEYIQPTDAALLLGSIKSLSVERFELPQGDPRSIAIKFEFIENEYFENTVLEKKFWWRRAKDGWAGLVSEPVDIKWKANKDLTGGLLALANKVWDEEKAGKTEETEAKKQLKKQIEKTGMGGVSFFTWFGFRGRNITPEEDREATKEEQERRQARKEGKEVEVEKEEEEEEEEEERDGFRSQLLAQGGMIGKLNVRKSGKVELDWGGMTLEMSPAAGMNFLTTAVIVEENDEKPQHGVVGGDSIGMGKIMGRFVLAPVWNDEEEWNVAPEELIAG